MLFEPAHEIMVLITQVISEGSDEPGHPRSLAIAFAVHKIAHLSTKLDITLAPTNLRFKQLLNYL